VKMRAFVAIEIPATAREAISAVIDKVRNSMPPARWVDFRNYHLTLRFLGDIEESTGKRLEAELEPIFRRYEPFKLRLGHAGTFPAGRPARVAWVGLIDAGPLEELAQEVRAVTAAFIDGSRSGRDRSFSPHLTVARCRRPWTEATARRWRRSVPGQLGEPFTVCSGSLMRSRLTPNGAIYDRVREFRLAGDI
jgi:2'-5' RNA ligase